jgi:hypothetical protein
MAENSLARQPDKVMDGSNICIKGFASINAFFIMPFPFILADICKTFPCKSHVPEIVVSLVTDVARVLKETKTSKNRMEIFTE